MKWKMGKLGEYCEITSSKRIFYSDYVSSGVPFYRSKEIIQKNAGQVIDEPLYIAESKFNIIKVRFGVPQTGDVLLTSVGTIGVPYVVSSNDYFYFKDGNLTWFRNFSDVLSVYFLYYWIQSHSGQGTLNSLTIGSSQKALTISALKEMSLPIPPIETQRKIADILSAYDDLIENNRKQIKLLEEAAMRLYREWFVNLRFPGHENAKITDGVPEGWEQTIIENVCQTVGGGTPSTKVSSYYDGGEILWVTPTDITKNNCLVILDTEKRITEKGLANSSAKMLPPDTILMTSRSSVGFFGMCEHEVCTNQGFISCIPNDNNMMMFLLLNLMNRVNEIRQKAGGATYLEINKATFRRLAITKPSSQVLDEFQKNAYTFLMNIRINKKIILALQQARDKLLPKLMSGEIEV